MSRMDYGNDDNNENYGKYWRNYHKFTLYTELAKPYELFYHTMYIGIDYILPSKET